MSDLISRQAVIDALKVAYWDKEIQSAKDDPCIVDAMTDWAIRMIKELPSADVPDTNVGKWTPCSERLPHAEKKGYWICTNSGYQCQCRWTNVNHFWTDLTTDWHWHIMDIPRHTEVVAWMPLPTAYKEGENKCSSK